MSKTGLVIVGGICGVIIIGAIWFFLTRPPVSPALPAVGASPAGGSTTTPSTQEAVLQATPRVSTAHPLPLAAADRIASWNFSGAYAGRPELMAKANDDILRFTALLATATSSKALLLVSVANDYELLGQGQAQYEYLGLAVRADETKGLPWHNLGVLMERLGALRTARIAYERATLVQPNIATWHYAYLEFLTTRMKDDTAAIEEAFAAAEKSIGADSYLLELRAAWKKS